MSLVSCPVCANSVSERAPTCPSCGHPLNTPSLPSHSKARVTSGGLGGAAFALLLFVFIGGLIAAAASKPSEAALRNALYKSYGPVYGIGVVAEKLGVVQFTYNDYFVYSTLSANLVTQPDKVVAYGYFGNSYAPFPNLDLGMPKPTASEPPRQPTPMPLGPNTNHSPVLANTTALPHPSELSPDEIHKNLREIYPIMKSEMQAEAMLAAKRKHPASNFVGSGCDEVSLSTESFQEVRWAYYGTYRCKMRGAILGLSNYDFGVQVEGQVEIRNGAFIRNLNGSRVLR